LGSLKGSKKVDLKEMYFVCIKSASCSPCLIVSFRNLARARMTMTGIQQNVYHGRPVCPNGVFRQPNLPEGPPTRPPASFDPGQIRQPAAVAVSLAMHALSQCGDCGRPVHDLITMPCVDFNCYHSRTIMCQVRPSLVQGGLNTWVRSHTDEICFGDIRYTITLAISCRLRISILCGNSPNYQKIN